MLSGSPVPGSSLALALKVRTRPVTPSTSGGREELPKSTVEEQEEEMDATESDDVNQAKDRTHCNVPLAIAPCSACCQVESDSQPNERTKTTI